MTDARFWLVWRHDGASPTVRHPTSAAAYAEANRLALRHPGAEFFVLEAVGRVVGEITVTAATLDPLGLAKRAAAAFPDPVVIGGQPLDWRPGPIQWPRPTPGQLGDPPPGAAYDYRPQPARGADDA